MRLPWTVAPLVALFVVGCGSQAGTVSYSNTEVVASATPDVGDLGVDGDGPLVAADDTVVPQTTAEPARSALLTAASNLNLRNGAGTNFDILAVIPTGSTDTLIDAVATSGFLHINWNGMQGWSSATYLTTSPSESTGTPGTDVSGPPSRANTIARAASAMGFSYYWGGGAWLSEGPETSTAGSCSGSCPSCSHEGAYGADCSGLVAKAWQYGSTDLSTNSHPYSTADLVFDIAGKWSTVARGSLSAGDALVYNTNGHGHTVVWEKGDGWGSSTVYECKGCSYGCVHNTRTFTSAYKGIRRAGF